MFLIGIYGAHCGQNHSGVGETKLAAMLSGQVLHFHTGTRTWRALRERKNRDNYGGVQYDRHFIEYLP